MTEMLETRVCLLDHNLLWNFLTATATSTVVDAGPA
jgi:hypothetical protein